MNGRTKEEDARMERVVVAAQALRDLVEKLGGLVCVHYADVPRSVEELDNIQNIKSNAKTANISITNYKSAQEELLMLFMRLHATETSLRRNGAEAIAMLVGEVYNFMLQIFKEIAGIDLPDLREGATSGKIEQESTPKGGIQ